MLSVLLKRFKLFLRESKECGIYCHADADGVCAAAVFARTLEKLGKQPVEFQALEAHEAEKGFSGKGDLAFFDLSADRFPELIKKAEGKKRVLIIDHHPIHCNVNSEKTVLIKPQLVSAVKPSAYPASKLCFDLCSSVVNLKGSEWIAAAGIIGDKSQGQWKGFVEKALEKEGLSMKELESIALLVEAVHAIKPEKISELFDLMVSSTPKAVLESEINSLRETLSGEVSEWKEKFFSDAEHWEKKELYFFKIKPKIAIKSSLIDLLSTEMPDKTIIIAEEKGNDVRFSARRQDFKIELNKVLENAVKGIPDSNAGGHIPAAGGAVPKKHFEEFKKNLLKELGEKT